MAGQAINGTGRSNSTRPGGLKERNMIDDSLSGEYAAWS